jgi:hypothetical protein
LVPRNGNCRVRAPDSGNESRSDGVERIGIACRGEGGWNGSGIVGDLPLRLDPLSGITQVGTRFLMRSVTAASRIGACLRL